MLSRVDERIGFMTPQQPIKLGANTDKVLLYFGWWLKNKRELSTFVHNVCAKVFCILETYMLKQNRKEG